MSIVSKKLLSAGLLTAGAALFIGAPSALAAPLPNPEPEPVPGVSLPPVNGDGQIQVSAPAVEVTAPEVGGPGGGEVIGVPVESVPNINGDPCTGGWESTVCYAEQQGDSPLAVQPRTSISSSP